MRACLREYRVGADDDGTHTLVAPHQETMRRCSANFMTDSCGFVAWASRRSSISSTRRPSSRRGRNPSLQFRQRQPLRPAPRRALSRRMLRPWDTCSPVNSASASATKKTPTCVHLRSAEPQVNRVLWQRCTTCAQKRSFVLRRCPQLEGGGCRAKRFFMARAAKRCIDQRCAVVRERLQRNSNIVAAPSASPHPKASQKDYHQRPPPQPTLLRGHFDLLASGAPNLVVRGLVPWTCSCGPFWDAAGFARHTTVPKLKGALTAQGLRLIANEHVCRPNTACTECDRPMSPSMTNGVGASVLTLGWVDSRAACTAKVLTWKVLLEGQARVV